jgi:hypothetical protein
LTWSLSAAAIVHLLFTQLTSQRHPIRIDSATARLHIDSKSPRDITYHYFQPPVESEAMADREQPYDPYIPSGGQGGAAPGAGQNPGNQRTAALQAVSAYLVTLEG